MFDVLETKLLMKSSFRRLLLYNQLKITFQTREKKKKERHVPTSFQTKKQYIKNYGMTMLIEN